MSQLPWNTLSGEFDKKYNWKRNTILACIDFEDLNRFGEVVLMIFEIQNIWIFICNDVNVISVTLASVQSTRSYEERKKLPSYKCGDHHHKEPFPGERQSSSGVYRSEKRRRILILRSREQFSF